MAKLIIHNSADISDFVKFKENTKNHESYFALVSKDNSEMKSLDIYKKKLEIIIRFMLPGVEAVIQNHDVIPDDLISIARKYVQDFNNNLQLKDENELLSIKNIMLSDEIRNFDFIEEFYKKLEGQIKRKEREIADFTFIDIFHFLSTFNDKWFKSDQIEYPDFDKMVSDEVNAKTKEVNDKLISITKTENTVNTLLENIQAKAKGIINKNYAAKFNDQAVKHNWISFTWLAAGILAIILFIILIFKAKIYDSLLTQDVINGVAVYNITNIVLKVAIISLHIFFISFAFKQFSVNRHLCTVNRHRANAFDSYEFFAAATKNDTESQKTLMLQLAKAIYEQTTTGYLGSKDNVNPSLLEITNLIKSTTGS